MPRLVLPKRALVVFTGPSGSGKSSLAFDTLYAEGQRRYLETLSAYARQFLGQLERPHVERIRGLSPTIAIEQKSAASNPRSTVGTITEVYDYLRVLYARVGEQCCVTCGKPVKARTAGEIAREMTALPKGAKVRVLARLVTHRKGEHKELFEDLKARGFLRVEVGGEPYSLDDPPSLQKHVKHTIDLVVDRVVIDRVSLSRLTEAVENALREGKGELVAAIDDGSGKEARVAYSANRACCGKSYPELSPQSFSFNSPLGMCPTCNGLGTRAEVDPSLVIVDKKLSIRGGAIAPWTSAMARGDGWIFRIAEAAAKACKVRLDTPWEKIPRDRQKRLLFGMQGERLHVSWGNERTSSHGTFGVRFEGVIPNLERLYRDTSSESMREHYKKFFRDRPCKECKGSRLRVESLAVFVGRGSRGEAKANGEGKRLNLAELTSLTVGAALEHVRSLSLTSSQKTIAEGALVEIDSRLRFLLDVGLEYLTLDRSGPSLSGGEAQRIRLASQLGSELSGVMYVLDEPSIGLHPRDNARLVSTLRHLRDLGNTVLVVEHDEETIRAADHVVDFGPGAGHLGGKVVAEGTPEQLADDPRSVTGAYLSGRKAIEVPARRRESKGAIKVIGAREHNLRGVDVTIPLGVLACVTGVSGAGKSSLVNGILLPALSAHLHNSTASVGAHDAIEGIDALDKVIAIDQKPIGRTPRSNPGTYTKSFDLIREVFAQLPEARARGYDAGRFSFNVKGGRCEACGGDGEVKVEMHFLADVRVPCEVCAGKRYDASTLEIRYKGKNVADVLETSVAECLELFRSFPQLKRILETLVSVGLGYMKIGQPAPTLSGGEAQRVKLSRELGKNQTGRTLYVLDEPTTGLHFEDIQRLLSVLQRLVDAGNTVVVIEHNLDVVKCADWIVDLGPEGGAGGGSVVCEGTPEQVARVKASYTGRFLAELLRAERARVSAARRDLSEIAALPS